MSRPGAALGAEVRGRAGGRCEYWRSPEAHAVIGFEVEHIIPVKHGGETTAANLALACFYCNRYKGPNVAGIAASGGVVTRLFPAAGRVGGALRMGRPGVELAQRHRCGDDRGAADQSAECGGRAGDSDGRTFVVTRRAGRESDPTRPRL